MRRILSVLLVLSLVATVVAPVWGSQADSQRHLTLSTVQQSVDHDPGGGSAAFSCAQQYRDDGWRDKLKKALKTAVKMVDSGCAALGVSAVVTDGATCAAVPEACAACAGWGLGRAIGSWVWD